MARRLQTAAWTRSWQRAVGKMTRSAVRAGTQVMADAARTITAKPAKPLSAGDWLSGMVGGPAGARRYYLYRPPGVAFGERLPLMVMLHGCRQDANGFALSTRMNRIAARERFLVLYPEQDRRANPQGCWNWYSTRSGQAHHEAATLMAAIDQVCLLYFAAPDRVAVAGISAGASMAALLATRYPARFKAVVMHCGIAPGMADSSMSALSAMRGRRTASAPAMGTAWPPLLVIHGEADEVVAAGNGRAAAQLWADAAGAAAGASRRVRRGARREMTVTDYKVRGRTVATLCEVSRMGHAWSGGDARQPYSDAQGPDASRMAWAFAVRRFAASD